MKVRSSLTPYPVLCAFSDDYKDSRFDASIRFTASANKIRGDIVFSLDNPEIKGLIKQGKAVYLVHVESPLTSFRKKFTSKDDHLQLFLNKEELADCIEICTFVIATGDIADYHSESFNALDSDLHISLAKGNVLAIGPAQEIQIQRKGEEAKDANSLIKIRKNQKGKPASIYVDTDGDEYIILGLDEELFDLYCETARGKYKQSVFSMIFLPAMIIILESMVRDYERGNKESEDRKWYNAIMELLEKKKYSLDSLISGDTERNIMEAAQVVFENPIKAALQELATLDGFEEE